MKILHLEDNPMDAELVQEYVSTEWPGTSIDVVYERAAFLDLLQRQEHDLIVSDFSLASFTGLEGFQLAKEHSPDIPFIFFSGTIPEGVAITAVRDGAADYVFKERPKRLITAIQHALQKKEEFKKRQALEERFRQLVEQASDGIFVFDESGVLRDVNQRACDSLGYDRETLLARNMAEIDANFVAPAAAAIRGRVLAGETATVSNDYRRKNQTVFSVETRLSRFDLPGEKLFLALSRDITERLRAESQIREQKNLLDQAHDAIVVTDLDQNVAYWNQGAERLLGWSAAETLGQPVKRFFGLASLAAEDEWRGDVSVQTKGGKALSLEMHFTLIRDESGRPKARLSISTDITEKNELKEQFFRAQRLECLGMLAAGIAHDLNNVLAPMLMAPPMLRERATDSRDIRMLDILEKSAERGTGLVRQILGFAHGKAGERRPLQLKHLLRDLGALLEQTFPKSIALEQFDGGDLWTIAGSATQVHQVLLNLAINARDAMPAGGTLRLKGENVVLDQAAARQIRNGKPGSWVKLTIEDTGTGILPEVVEKMWNPFFTTKAPGKGTGLGLSTVRGIVESHGGFLSLQTEMGRGTAFAAYFPSVEIAGRSGTHHPLLPVPRGLGELVLIVDDDATVREVAGTLLDGHGYQVFAAADGIEAMEHFVSRADEMTLAIINVNLPGANGARLGTVLRRLNPSLKILATSGLAEEAQSFGEGKLVADAFITKPFKPESLLRTVRACIDAGKA